MADLNDILQTINRRIGRLVKQQEREIARKYAKVLVEIRAELAKQYEKYENDGKLSLQEMLKHDRLKKMMRRIEHMLKAHYKDINGSMEKILKNAYIDGFYHTAWAVETYTKTKLGYSSMRPETLTAMLRNPVAGLTLNERLERQRALVIYQIQQKVTAGLQNNASYATMSKELKKDLEGDTVKAMRIVRTEGHRVQESAKHDAMDHANKNGVVMMKQWNSLEDERVRRQPKNAADHRKLNDKKIKQTELFDDGLSKGLAPGLLPAAASSINCRCFLTYSVEKIERPQHDELEGMTFEEWEKERIGGKTGVENPIKQKVSTKQENNGLSVQTEFPTDFKQMPKVRPRKRLKDFDTHEEGLAYREARDKDLAAFKDFEAEQVKEFKEKETFFKTRDEAEQYIKANIIHPKRGKVDISGIDLQIVSAYCRMFDKVAKDFPRIKNSYLFFDNEKGERGDGYVMEASGGIHFGNHKVEELFDNMVSHAQSNYTIGGSIYTVFLHEIGHWVDNNISRPPLGQEVGKDGGMNRSKGAFWKDKFFANSGISSHIRKMQGLRRSKDFDDYDKVEEQSKEFLSEYSAHNEAEMFAELFSASYSNVADNKPIVGKFRKWLQQVSDAEKKGLNKVINSEDVSKEYDVATTKEGLDIWHD